MQVFAMLVSFHSDVIFPPDAMRGSDHSQDRAKSVIRSIIKPQRITKTPLDRRKNFLHRPPFGFRNDSGENYSRAC